MWTGDRPRCGLETTLGVGWRPALVWAGDRPWCGLETTLSVDWTPDLVWTGDQTKNFMHRIIDASK